MGRYYIDYNTGAGNQEFVGTLTEAKAEADEGAAYTQKDISIYDAESRDANKEPITKRYWYGTEAYEDEENIISFGDFGFYADWTD